MKHNRTAGFYMHIEKFRFPLTGCLLACSLGIFATGCSAQLPANWAGKPVGDTKGSESYRGETYTVTSNGTNFQWDRPDSGRFVSTAFPAGNFKFIARLVSLSGGPSASAGLMARENEDPKSVMASVLFLPATKQFSVISRDIGNAYHQDAMASPLDLPCWIKLVRLGNKFAAYRSSDGKTWAVSCIPGGGQFSTTAPLHLGFFVNSGSGDAAATATFDNVSMSSTDVMPYKTSWLGNTYGDNTDHVSGITSAMYVAPDGTCYTNAPFEEAAQSTHIYKDGKILPGLGYPMRNSGVSEGSITGDGEHVFLCTQYGDHENGIIRVDMKGQNTTPLFTTTPIHFENGMGAVSGMATGNDELYVSDAATDQVLVLNKSVEQYMPSPGGVIMRTQHAVDTTGVTNPAPQAVYQSARKGYLGYVFKGLTPGVKYTVRYHFAELDPKNDAPGKHVFNTGTGWPAMQPSPGKQMDIFKEAGAVYKAYVLAFPDVICNNDTTLQVGAMNGSGQPDFWGQANGIEILKPDGTPFIRLNCGGPAIPGTDWVGESAEKNGRSFAFTRPGPLAVDKRGFLWIAQRCGDYPTSYKFVSTPGLAAIKCYDKNGVYQNREITDVINPLAVTYDPAQDRLLVAEDGPDQNIRIYTGLETAPKCTSTFGPKGGIFAGKTPGVMCDAESGNWARFFTPTGVGVDSTGNIYVASSYGNLHTDIRSLKPDGSLNWKLQGLEFCNIGDFDQAVPSSDVWTSFRHYKMNWGTTVPGGEWSLYSYGWDPFKRGHGPDNEYNSCAIYRKFGPEQRPFIFSGGQGFLGDVFIRRFEGEQMIPCGKMGLQGKFWFDTNGDGEDQPDEDVQMTGPGSYKPDIAFFDVADNGDLYFGGAAQSDDKSHWVIRKLTFKGFTERGVPQYDGINKNIIFIPAPASFIPQGGMRARMRYQSSTDTLYLMSTTAVSQDENTHTTTLTRMDHISTNPSVAYAVTLPNPITDPNQTYGAGKFPAGDGFCYMAFDVANDKVFACDLAGTIHVLNTSDGKQITTLLPGPEVCGFLAWEDEGMGIRAHYNKTTGSYYVLTENSGWASKQNLFRWKP